MTEPLFWLVLNIISIIVLSFYSMMEMACVSFNKVRLQYLISQGNKKAEHLNYILKDSSRLFGTTLIGVNLATMVGSEFSREFYSSLGLSPDIAPLTQVMVVIIFGELAPMFAARRYPEHTSLLGANLLYISALLMQPILWLIGQVTKITNKLLRDEEKSLNIYLNLDEIKKVLEERQDEIPAAGSPEELNQVITNIFTFRGKKAKNAMQPLKSLNLIPSNASVSDMRNALKNTESSYLVAYHKEPSNIVGIALPRDYLKESSNHRISDHLKQPWYISQETDLIQVLHQFRKNKQSIAVVLDRQGKAVGALTLQDVIDEIFVNELLNTKEEQIPFIERTFPGDMKISEFNKLLHVNLHGEGDETLADLLIKTIGHQPEQGESITLFPFEIEAKEATLLEVKSVTVKTIL